MDEDEGFSFPSRGDDGDFLSDGEYGDFSFSEDEDEGFSLSVDEAKDFSFSTDGDRGFSFNREDDGDNFLSDGKGEDFSFSDEDGNLSLLCDEDAVLFFSEDELVVLSEEFSRGIFFFDTLLSFNSLADGPDFSFFLDVPSSCPFFLTVSFPDFSVFVVLSSLLPFDVFTSSFFTFKGLSGFFFFFLVAFAILSSPKIFCIIMSNPDDTVSFTTTTLGDLGRLLAMTGDVDLFSEPGDADDLPAVELSFPLVSKLFSGK